MTKSWSSVEDLKMLNRLSPLSEEMCLNSVPTQEEADTRMLLHAKDAVDEGFQRTIIVSQDTDVLVLLVSFSDVLSQEVWMKTGTIKHQTYIEIKKIECEIDIKANLFAFDAITGSDSTSQFAGIGKKSAWKVYRESPHLLQHLGDGHLPDHDTLSASKEFICKLYEPSTNTKCIHISTLFPVS